VSAPLSFHIPTGQNPVGIGEKERRTQADEITPSDLCNQARLFYRSYAHMRSIPHKTPDIVAIALAIFSVYVVHSQIPHRHRHRGLRSLRVVSRRKVPWWAAQE